MNPLCHVLAGDRPAQPLSAFISPTIKRGRHSRFSGKLRKFSDDTEKARFAAGKVKREVSTLSLFRALPEGTLGLPQN